MGNFMCGVGGGGFLGSIFTIIIWAIIVWAIIAIIQHFNRRRYDEDYRDDRYQKNGYRKAGAYRDEQIRRDKQRSGYNGNYEDKGYQNSRHDAALEILRQRYARGEITREEFEAGKRDLM